VDVVYECTERFFSRFTHKGRPDALLSFHYTVNVTAVVCPATAIDCKTSWKGVLCWKAGGALGRRLSVKQKKEFPVCYKRQRYPQSSVWFYIPIQFHLQGTSFYVAMATRGPGQCDIAFSRTALEEWSACRGDLYLTAHNIHERDIQTPLGFEPAIPSSKRPHSHALE
jgi:hypothetical protein